MDDMLYRLENEEELLSPQLIYYEELIKKNTALAIKMAGSPERLWPHVKSHKTRELIRLQMVSIISNARRSWKPIWWLPAVPGIFCLLIR